jgi:hypothetical protein
MEPKAKTIIERHGFQDPDHHKSRHDEIQIWVLENFHTVIKHLLPSQAIDTETPLGLKLEHVIVDGKYVVGFVDVFCTRLGIAVEIKTEIPLIGELLRQIQFYKNYVGGYYWVVVSPDDRYANVLTAQGILFFKYPDAAKQQLLF